MAEQWWAGVRERVEAAGTGAGGGDVFGALGHAWALEDPLTPDELAALEAQLGVRLPEEYRAFLLYVGAGGAGPAYGLFPVRRTEGGWCWEGDGADLADLSMLAEPFPDQGPDPKLLAELLAQHPDEEELDDIEDFDDAMEAWDERWGSVMFAPERTAGALVICHLGCAQREWLIVSGTHRGTIWSDCRADDIDLAPLLDEDGAPVTFARWYTGWLEKAEHTALPAL
ncbi:SMI1/KNR4 family protein [Streptomyces sp. NBC_01460]|uniref:SMI1/KNR4 family protein n=1 Tax=Streptomyces sp. NBC_01460 TaxID=2903875 RepID=UPI002E381563|nr:SMI1/KNR4 family protein [Streptomyces sp. NBC_01460]